MIKSMEISDRFEEVINALNNGGAFLTSRDENGRVNIMTIGWGTLGTIWGKQIFLVLVRESRYTFSCMNRGDSFTVGIPLGKMKKELAFCGSKSGRDYDKVKKLGITLIDGKKVDVPAIQGCQICFECKIINRKLLHKDDFVSPEILSTCYPHGNHHMLFFGEIVASYCEERT